MSGGGAEFEYPDEAGYPDGMGTLHEGTDEPGAGEPGAGAPGGEQGAGASADEAEGRYAVPRPFSNFEMLSWSFTVGGAMRTYFTALK